MYICMILKLVEDYLEIVYIESIHIELLIGPLTPTCFEHVQTNYTCSLVITNYDFRSSSKLF